MGVLAKVTVLDSIVVNESGVVRSKFATYVTEDGVRISSPAYHIVTFTPDMTLPSTVVVDAHGTEAAVPKRVKDIATAVWDKATVDAFLAKKQALAEQLQTRK